MASFSKSASSLIFALLVILVVIEPSSARLIGRTDATTNDLSGDICSGTLDPSFCLQVMSSIPGAVQTPSLESLGQTAITYALPEAEKTHKFVQSLVGSAADPKLKANYKSCASNYDDAIGGLEEAKDMLKNKDYSGVSTMASGGMSEMDSCDENFKPGRTADPAQLAQKNKYFNMLCVIILRVANKLRGPV